MHCWNRPVILDASICSMKLYKTALIHRSGMCPNKLVDVLRRERNNFNPPVAFLKPNNEGIAEFIRLLASEMCKTSEIRS